MKKRKKKELWSCCITTGGLFELLILTMENVSLRYGMVRVIVK